MGIELKPGWLYSDEDAEGKLLVRMIDGVTKPTTTLQAHIERVQNAMEVKASASSLRAQGYPHEANVANRLADEAIRIASIK